MEERKITLGDLLERTGINVESNYIRLFDASCDEMGYIKSDCALLKAVYDRPVKRVDVELKQIGSFDRPILVIELDGGEKDE